MKKHLYSLSLSTLLVGALSIFPAQETNGITAVENSTEVVDNGHGEVHWSYEGETGPEYWGGIAAEFASCSQGKEQSPINLDITKAKKVYKQQRIKINYEPTTVNVVNNGHTIQANLTNEKNKIVIDGTEYKLVQFHFHTPSEHQFDGKNLPIEYHLVHKSADGKLAVVGVMVEEGAKNEALANIWSNLPKQESVQAIEVKKPVDLDKLLPRWQTSFRYNGSLTTPPCSEGVKWIVYKDTVKMSADQIKAFSDIISNNNRPVQDINNRNVIIN